MGKKWIKEKRGPLARGVWYVGKDGMKAGKVVGGTMMVFG